VIKLEGLTEFRWQDINKQVMKNELKDELTYKIIGCAMKVHSTLGNGFQEVIYQRCLAIELERHGLRFVREQEMPIYYGNISVGTRRADFVVEDCVLIELKAVIRLEDVHLAQGLNYLEAYRIEKGLLINFGSPGLEVKRLFRKHNHVPRNPVHPPNPDHPDHPDHPDSDS
jgi:GxxExxY protein